MVCRQGFAKEQTQNIGIRLWGGGSVVGALLGAPVGAAVGDDVGRVTTVCGIASQADKLAELYVTSVLGRFLQTRHVHGMGGGPSLVPPPLPPAVACSSQGLRQQPTVLLPHN